MEYDSVFRRLVGAIEDRTVKVFEVKNLTLSLVALTIRAYPA